MQLATKPLIATRSVIGDTFSFRRNSLNFLRLVLASLVMVTHASQLSHPGSESIRGKMTIASFAIYGFFGISGFLITQSAVTKPLARYLWHRFLRIFPAFWVCLFAIAFGFALVAWWRESPVDAARCGISCYVHGRRGPFGYMWHNAFLWIDQPNITGSLKSVPLPGIWNGSFWTLSYEFLLYLIMGGLAATKIVDRKWSVIAIAGVTWIALVVVTAVPQLNNQVNFLNNVFWKNVLELFPVFLMGSILWVKRKYIPDSGWLALGSALLFLGGLLLPIGGSFPAYTLTSTDVTGIFIVYPMIWLGIHLPFHRVGSSNDYSYGMYIYGFPILQILAVFGFYKWGVVPYGALAIALTIPFAVTSWWLVEKRSLKLKSWRPDLPSWQRSRHSA